MPRGLHFFCLLGVASTSPCRAWLCHRICTAWPWEARWTVDVSSGLRQPNFTGIEKQDLATWGLVETPELRSRRFTSIFANIDVWQKLQPKLGWRNFASIFEKLDFQRLLQSELGCCSFTSIFAKFDFWCWLQPKLERGQRCQHLCINWHLARISTRAWIAWFYQHLCKHLAIWLLFQHVSTKAWVAELCQNLCKNWHLRTPTNMG